MTVSPRRAQDGQQPQPTAQQATAPPQAGGPELPPTLFTLRHLNPSSADRSAVTAEPPNSQPPESFPDGDRLADAAPMTEEPQPTAKDHKPRIEPSTQTGPSTQAVRDPRQTTGVSATSPPAEESMPRPETPLADAAPPKTPAQPGFPSASKDPTTPAGRTWMERLGSHALVLSMLLIVVAAALLTGRKPGDPSELDDAVAAGNADPLEFDANLDAELPIPEHYDSAIASSPRSGHAERGTGHDEQGDAWFIEDAGSSLDPASTPLTGNAVASSSSSLQASTGETDAAINRFPQDGHSSHVDQFSTGEQLSREKLSSTGDPVSGEPPFTRKSPTGFDVGQENFSSNLAGRPTAENIEPATDVPPGVSLNHATASGYATPNKKLIADVQPKVEVNRYFDGSKPVEASTVSNRTVLDDEALSVPTLEELESTSPINVAPPAHRGPHFSRTPFGLADSDLMRHLDRMIEENSRRQSDAAASSIPNSN